jgi:chromosome partitioning protein
MRTIAFLTQKGGAGKTTLAASLAVAAAAAGERVVALDFDPQGSLARWGKRRESANAPNAVVVEPFEIERLPRLGAILDGLAGAGFTLAVFDTAGTHTGALRLVAECADLCLLPARPTLLDVEATAASFRAVYVAKRKAAFVLNQCPPTYRSSRASEAAKDLTRLGVLAEPMLSARIDYQDAIAAGLGVTEHAREGRAAQEIEALWSWIRTQFEGIEREARAAVPPAQRASALSERLAGIARAPHLRPTAEPTTKAPSNEPA